jgi:hypothetical protein
MMPNSMTRKITIQMKCKPSVLAPHTKIFSLVRSKPARQSPPRTMAPSLRSCEARERSDGDGPKLFRARSARVPAHRARGSASLTGRGSALRDCHAAAGARAKGHGQLLSKFGRFRAETRYLRFFPFSPGGCFFRLIKGGFERYAIIDDVVQKSGRVT